MCAASGLVVGHRQSGNIMGEQGEVVSDGGLFSVGRSRKSLLEEDSKVEHAFRNVNSFLRVSAHASLKP